MTLRLNGSTSGYTEIDAPASAGNNTLVLPTGNGSSGQALQTNGSGVLSWGPGVANDGQLCKAWVNFNGTGTVAIRASYNVSSITDDGTGNYTVNFTTAMPDANYAFLGTTTRGSTGELGAVQLVFNSTFTTSAARFRTFGTNDGVDRDLDKVFVAIFR